jgi:hypothetical protein
MTILTCTCGKKYPVRVEGIGNDRHPVVQAADGKPLHDCPECTRDLVTQWWKQEIERWISGGPLNA